MTPASLTNMDNSSYVYLSLAFLTLVYASRRVIFKRHLPPGPKPLPLVGNLFDVPSTRPWLKFAEWKAQYGDVVYLNVLGQPMLVLNSLEACNDLLDKRSAVYSDREPMTMTIELAGWDYNFGVMRHTPRWRRHRRVFVQHFSSSATLDHRPIQESNTHILVRRLIQAPERFLDHVRLTFAEVIMKVCYDIDVKGHDDPYIEIAAIVLGPVFTASLPGRYLVNTFPLLKYVPEWMPGAGFKRQAREWNKVVRNMRDLPFNEAQENMARGVAGPSVVSSILSQSGGGANGVEDLDSVEDIAADISASAFAGGADTTVCAVQAFFLAMMLYPEVQKLAQAEVDTLTCKHRLPTFTDRGDLPYVNAVIKELIRWHVIAPLGVPHVLTEDDEYNGYFIPKGTSVISNTWLILHNAKVYPDPEVFNPSRWLIETREGLKPNLALPEPLAAFGYGRRACPGRHFAENHLFIIVVNLLACFDVTPSGSSSHSFERSEELFTDDLISCPIPFQAIIKPRSERVVLLVNEAMAAAD